MSKSTLGRSDSSRKLRESLKELAVTVEVVSSVPITTYYKLAEDLKSTALIEWEKHKNFEQAYVHLMKLSKLLVEKIPTHNGFMLKQYEPQRSWARRIGDETIKQLERIVIALDKIEDEKIRIQQDLHLIEALEDRDESEPTAGTEETESITPTIDPLAIFENRDQFIKKPENMEVKSDAVTTMRSSTTMLGTSSVSTIEPQNIKMLFDKLRLSSSENSTLSIPQPTVQPISTSTTIEGNRVPSYESSIIQTSVPSRLYFNYSTTCDDDNLCFYRAATQPLVPISTQEAEILLYLGDIQRFPLPHPRNTTLSIRLPTKAGITTYTFSQDDYHASFQIFLNQIPPYLQITPSAVESNRCFFIHLGVAIHVHPFALQVAFRARAQQILRSCSDDLAKELLGTILQPADLVDANAFVYLWPEEFLNLRIGILSGTLEVPILSIFQSAELPIGVQINEVMLRCSGCHFTYLRPMINPQMASSMKRRSQSYLNQLAGDMKSAGFQVLECPISNIIDGKLHSWSLFDTLRKLVVAK